MTGWETSNRLRCPRCGRVGWMTVVPGHGVNEAKCPDCGLWFDKRGRSVPNGVPSARGRAQEKADAAVRLGR